MNTIASYFKISYFQDALKLKILQLGSSNLHKRYMAKKVSMVVIWPGKQSGHHIKSFISPGVLLFEGLISPFSLLHGLPNVKITIHKQVMA